MDLQMILFIALIIIFFIIPLLAFIIKSAVKQGILEAYKIIKNDKDKIIEWIDNKINQKNFMKKEELEIDDNDTVIYFINTLYICKMKQMNKETKICQLILMQTY